MRRPQEVPLGEHVLAVSDPEPPNVRELLRAVGRLPSNQRSALAMRELEGRTYPEIAETLGVTVPAVEALIARARSTLRMRAGTLRGGLAALLGPRSLRKLWENGEPAAGGALGTGVMAKAAALVLVGITGFASVEAGTPRGARTTRSVPARHAVSSSVVGSAPARAPRSPHLRQRRLSLHLPPRPARRRRPRLRSPPSPRIRS